MKNFKLLFLVFSLSFLNSFAQDAGIYQGVNVEKYQGKNFVIESKIFYKTNLANGSYAVLGYSYYDAKGKMIKKIVYNDDAGDYYKQGEWSNYELSGKVDKKAKYLGVMAAIGGNASYYLDDFKLFIKDGANKIEIPLVNPGFEINSLQNWQTYSRNSNTKFTISSEKAFSGKNSLLVDNSSVKVAPTLGNNEELGKYMDVNGVKLYYEIYGKGEPLLLIHGNNTSMAIFKNQLDVLSKKYMVIGLDSRGQGKSTGNDTKLTYELMAEDVNTFLDKMNLKNVDILGWSDGGNIAVILAMNHPDKVHKMAIMGTVLYNDDTSVKPEINKLIRKQLKDWDEKGISKNSMNYRLKMLLLTEPHVNPDSLEKIKAPTLVMAGEFDIVKEKHTKLIAEKIPNSKLVIFKGADHEAPEKIPQLFNETVLDFFAKNN